MAEPPVVSALRSFSKDALGRRHRLEVAAAVHRLPGSRVHASMVLDSLKEAMALSKVSDELTEYADWGLLRRVDADSRNTVYEVQDTVYFRFAAQLEKEARRRYASSEASGDQRRN